jgi:peptide-methionine (R)-S-oxide reductase
MRFPSIPTIIRAFHTVSNTAFIRANPRTLSTPQRTIYRSMPNIPFFGALFGSSSMADNTQYPVQKAEGEWQAQLSPGMSARTILTPTNVDRAIPRAAQEGH